MSAGTRGHQWGVVAQAKGMGDIEYCPLCNRYACGGEYIRKRDIPRDARVVDSARLFWEAS